MIGEVVSESAISNITFRIVNISGGYSNLWPRYDLRGIGYDAVLYEVNW